MQADRDYAFFFRFCPIRVCRPPLCRLQHDFISESPPCVNFDIIFLRNSLLKYYEPPTKIRAFVRISSALGSWGFLIIGINEEIPTGGLLPNPYPEYRCIFKKISPSQAAYQSVTTGFTALLELTFLKSIVKATPTTMEKKPISLKLSMKAQRED